MGIIVDLIIILIFALCVFMGYKRGLAKSLLKAVAAVLAIIIAIIAYKPFVNFIIEETTIDENIAYSLERAFIENKSDDEKVISEDSGIPKPIVEYLNNNIDSKKDEAISEVSKNASILIIDAAAIIIVYIIAKILLKIIMIFTDIFAKLPVIKQCNELGGIIYGILEAIVIILIVLTIISVITPLVGNYNLSNIIMQSHIGKFFYDNNIFLNLIF